MANYSPLNTADEDAPSSSQPVENPISTDYDSQRGRQSQPTRSNTANSNVSPHDMLLDDRLKREPTRWSSNTTIFGVDAESVRHSIAPQWHEEKNPLDTARPFIYRRQAWRLSRLAISEFLITALLCGLLGGIIRYYEQILYLPLRARQDFNAAVTLLALLLAINLAASLRSYAKLLRWRMLSYTYRPLRTFDLVLGCDSLLNVVKLLFISRNDSYPYLPSWTQVLACFWLLTNAGMFLAVGCLGLNYNMLTMYASDLTSPGMAYIPDLSAVLEVDYIHSLDYLQGRGSGAFNVQYSYLKSLDYDSSQGSGTFSSLNQGTTKYFFIAFLEDGVTSAVSRVFIRNDVVCTQYPVTEGILGRTNSFTYMDNDKPVNMTYPGFPVDTWGTLAMSNMNSTCGDRCTNVNIFQAGSEMVRWEQLGWTPDQVPQSYLEANFYQCNSTIQPISEVSLDGESIAQPPELQLSDDISRMLAGSVGWSPYPNLLGNSWLYQSYPNSSSAYFRPMPNANWGGEYPNPTITEQVQDYISCFNMGAIVSASTLLPGGVGYQARYLEDAPSQALTLIVYWPWILAILAGMPAAQLVALIIVLLLANNTIIRDDSHLAISKVYFNLLKKYDLGEKGCMLHADELVRHMDTKVAYTWRDLPDHERNGRPVGHVDVYEQPLYRFKISSGKKTLKSRPEQTTWPQDKYYD